MPHVADICLYGTRDHGFGYLADSRAGLHIGDGALTHRTATAAYWTACQELRTSGCDSGIVRVFAPGGEFVAEGSLDAPPWYGDLKWDRAEAFAAELNRN